MSLDVVVARRGVERLPVREIWDYVTNNSTGLEWSGDSDTTGSGRQERSPLAACIVERTCCEIVTRNGARRFLLGRIDKNSRLRQHACSENVNAMAGSKQ
jgi:hypothetical protein